MQTKTYFASSVPAALEVARKELGEEAMLVTSKLASAAARPFGRLEVTFAYDAKVPATARPDTRISGTFAQSRTVAPSLASSWTPSIVPSAASPVASPSASPVVVTPAFGVSSISGTSSASVGARSMTSEMDEIKRQISELKQAVGRPAVVISEGRPGLADQLIENGLSKEVAGEVAAAVRANDSPNALLRELTARLQVAPFAEPKAGDSRTIALVGPPGRGKTTTLVKIALRYGLSLRVPVKIYFAGSHGVGGDDQMARYATLLGVPFQACESLESLSLALNGDQWKGLALIDTPGISPSDSGEIGDFARFFKRRTEIEKHLVLRADARSADLSHVISHFAPMDVSRLLFTGLDEVVSLGSMADAMMRTRIPSALAGTGQRIPEDLEMVDAARLAQLIQGEHASAAIAA